MNLIFKRSTVIIFSLLLLVASVNVWEKKAYADSPITSTTFYNAYLDIEMVAEAHHSGLSQEVTRFIASNENPLDQRAAAINAIYSSYAEWDDRNLTDEYAKTVYGKPASSLNFTTLRGDERFVLGYLKALDHYKRPDAYWLGLARESLPNSMTVALVQSVVKSNESPEAVWFGNCYLERNFADKGLIQDIRQGAIDMITDYLSLYKKDEPCQDEVSELISNSIALTLNQPQTLIFGQLEAVDPSNSLVTPYVKSGITYVPLAFVAKAFGATVNYDKKLEEITIGHEYVKYTPLQKLVFRSKDSGTRFEVRNGRAFVPLRAISVPFRMQVYYSQGLIILSKGIVLNPKLAHDQLLASKVRGKLK